MSLEPVLPPSSARSADTARTRVARQRRSAERQLRIEKAAITVIARHGIANLTHRLVAKEADVSLAATTYHYQGRHDIIADAAARLLDEYAEAFQRFVGRHAEGSTLCFRDFVVRVVTNAVGKHWVGTLAWCEIILDGTRDPVTRSIATGWFDRLFDIWLEIATAFRVKQPEQTVRSAIDIVVGLVFMASGLGVDHLRMAAVLERGGDPARFWVPLSADDQAIPVHQSGRKAQQTRERILAAAIDILIAQGAGSVNYRTVAARTGMSAPAAIYHFPTTEVLLTAAQTQLFEASKQRYRAIMASVDYDALDPDRLADLAATIFQREATECAEVSIADYPIWIEAARHPRLRPAVRQALSDQNLVWIRLLRRVAPDTGPRDALLMQSLFRGKLIRIIATGARLGDLAEVRANFVYGLAAITHREGEVF